MVTALAGTRFSTRQRVVHRVLLGLSCLDLSGGVVTGVNQQRADVIGGHDVRIKQEGRNNLLAVVIGFGVVSFGLITLRVGLHSSDCLGSQLAGVLEDG